MFKKKQNVYDYDAKLNAKRETFDINFKNIIYF